MFLPSSMQLSPEYDGAFSCPVGKDDDIYFKQDLNIQLLKVINIMSSKLRLTAAEDKSIATTNMRYRRFSGTNNSQIAKLRRFHCIHIHQSIYVQSTGPPFIDIEQALTRIYQQKFILSSLVTKSNNCILQCVSSHDPVARTVQNRLMTL